MSLDSKKPTELDAEIGARIRRRRKALKMNQTELGLVAGVSYQQVVKYEQGANRAASAALVAFANALSVHVGFFFGEELNADYEESAIVRFIHSPEGVELNEAYARLDGDKRQMVLGIVEDMGALHSRLGSANAVHGENRACM